MGELQVRFEHRASLEVWSIGACASLKGEEGGKTKFIMVH